MKSPSHGPEPCASANSAISACVKFDNKDMIAYLMENVKSFLKFFTGINIYAMRKPYLQ